MNSTIRRDNAKTRKEQKEKTIIWPTKQQQQEWENRRGLRYRQVAIASLLNDIKNILGKWTKDTFPLFPTQLWLKTRVSLISFSFMRTAKLIATFRRRCRRCRRIIYQFMFHHIAKLNAQFRIGAWILQHDIKTAQSWKQLNTRNQKFMTLSLTFIYDRKYDILLLFLF